MKHCDCTRRQESAQGDWQRKARCGRRTPAWDAERSGDDSPGCGFDDGRGRRRSVQGVPPAASDASSADWRGQGAVLGVA